MKTGIKTTSSFNVDNVNKVVVCTMKVDLNLPVKDYWYSFNSEVLEKRFPKIDYGGVFTVKAKARCNSDDTFDPEVGKRIAESRAKIKAFKTAFNVHTAISNDIMKAYKQVGGMKKSLNVLGELEKKHLNELLK